MDRIRGLISSPLKMTLLVAVAAAFAALVGPGAATRVDAGTARSPGCYPGNQFVYYGLTGLTDAEGAGKGSFTSSEYELTPTDDGTDHGGGTMQWAVRGTVTGPDSSSDTQTGMSGNLSLQVNFTDYPTPMIFKTKCAAEVQTEAEKTIEMEFEGTVNGFPGYPDGTKAVTTIQMSPNDLGGYNAKFSVEIGTTCFEDSAEIGFGTPDNTPSADAWLRVKNLKKDVGRWGFPDTYGPGNCPDAF